MSQYIALCPAQLKPADYLRILKSVNENSIVLSGVRAPVGGGIYLIRHEDESEIRLVDDLLV